MEFWYETVCQRNLWTEADVEILEPFLLFFENIKETLSLIQFIIQVLYLDAR
jgi:hypothetical protein